MNVKTVTLYNTRAVSNAGGAANINDITETPTDDGSGEGSHYGGTVAPTGPTGGGEETTTPSSTGTKTSRGNTKVAEASFRQVFYKVENGLVTPLDFDTWVDESAHMQGGVL